MSHCATSKLNESCGHIGDTLRATRILVFAVGALTAASVAPGCDCSGDPGGLSGVKAFSCELEQRRPSSTDTACPGDRRFANGDCVPARCDSGDVGCCPGTVCTQGGECQVPARFREACEADSDCQVPGQRCLTRPLVSSEHKTCGFSPRDSAGECPAETYSFNSRCVAQAPCDGGCGANQVCNIDTNNCDPSPTYAPTCAQTCGDAELLVYSNPSTMLFNQCCAVECACETVPPLAPGRWGRYSAMAVAENNLYVSAYDTTYGDLVLGIHSRLSGDLQTLEYVDGLPQSGPVVAHPNGPRGGMDGPGPDVGTHTSIALHNQQPRIAYYDEDHGQLKYAAYHSNSNSWTISLIDDARLTPEGKGDVGRYTSLAIGDDGIAHVTYYANRIEVDGVLVTTPMYARATTENPAGYDDWVHVPIDPLGDCAGCGPEQVCVLNDQATPTCANPLDSCGASCACDEACVNLGGATCRRQLAERLDLPCNGSCQEGESCVADGAGSTCLPTTAGACGGSCTANELCVNDGNASVCRTSTPFSVLAGLPDGNGLFTSMILDGATVTVAYYDRIRAHLRGAFANFGTTDSTNAGFTSMPLACDPLTDVGQHPSLSLSPLGGLGIAFQGDDGKTLWLWEGNTLADLDAQIAAIDDGDRGAGNIHFVGAYASLAYDATGRPIVAYADQTDNNLLLAWRNGDTWQSNIILSEGAFGSFAKLLIREGVAYMSTYQRTQTLTGRDQSRLIVRLVSISSLAQ